jgi:hypothetical protein
VEFTISKTHTAQIDCVVPGLNITASSVAGGFEWIQSADSPATSFGVRTPPSAADVKVTPSPSGPPKSNPAGERLYGSGPLTLQPGQKQLVSFAYTVGSGSAPAASGGGNTALIILLVLLVLAIGVTAMLFVRQYLHGATGSADGDAVEPEQAQEPEDAPDEDGAPEGDDWGFDETE